MVSKDTIDIYKEKNRLINDSIDRIVVEVYKRKREHKENVFLLVGSSVGCGTTTTAINLSVALAESGWKTVLLDCDIRKGMQYKRLNEFATKGLADYLNEGMEECIYHSTIERLDYIPCGHFTESPVRLFCSKGMEQMITSLKNQYDFVIMDFPSLNVVPDAKILMPIVDQVILIATINETSSKQLEEARQKILPEKYMGIVANKVDLVQYRHHIKDYDYFGEKKLEGRFKASIRKKRGSNDAKKAKKTKKERKK